VVNRSSITFIKSFCDKTPLSFTDPRSRKSFWCTISGMLFISQEKRQIVFDVQLNFCTVDILNPLEGIKVLEANSSVFLSEYIKRRKKQNRRHFNFIRRLFGLFFPNRYLQLFHVLFQRKTPLESNRFLTRLKRCFYISLNGSTSNPLNEGFLFSQQFYFTLVALGFQAPVFCTPLHLLKNQLWCYVN
jgi:hypothetical protein